MSQSRDVTRIASPPSKIPVIFDTVQNPRGSEGRKATTITRIAPAANTIITIVPHFARHFFYRKQVLMARAIQNRNWSAF